MLSLDLCKAFDSLSWDYLFYALKWYGFGPRFLAVLRTLYNGPTARILVKGYSSHQLDIHRGTRQGCPLSPILFILVLEPLPIKLRNHPNIKGIHCGDLEHKCALFADDILLLLTAPVTSLPILFCVMYHVSIVSGLTINHTKSIALNLSLEANTVTQLQNSFPFKWQTKALPYLGISLTPTIDKLYVTNYPPLYKKMMADLYRWERNPPSWFGRLYTIKMNLLPRLLYLFRTLPVQISMPDLHTFQNGVLKIIWGKKETSSE